MTLIQLYEYHIGRVQDTILRSPSRLGGAVMHMRAIRYMPLYVFYLALFLRIECPSIAWFDIQFVGIEIVHVEYIHCTGGSTRDSRNRTLNGVSFEEARTAIFYEELGQRIIQSI